MEPTGNLPTTPTLPAALPALPALQHSLPREEMTLAAWCLCCESEGWPRAKRGWSRGLALDVITTSGLWVDPAPWLFAHKMFYDSFTHTKLVLASGVFPAGLFTMHICVHIFNEAEM